MAEKGSNIPVAWIVAGALVAGALAGGLGLYVMGGMSGNTVASAPDAGGGSCEVADATRKAVSEAIGGEVAAMLPADPPQDLSSLAFDGPDGAPMTLADLSGKTLLVNLWATWCAPCRAEMPALDALQAELGGDEFEVVAINVDTGGDEKPRKFLEEIGIGSLAYYRDDTIGVFNELKRRSLALGLPVTLLIDAKGCLIANMNGPAEWASEDAKALVRAAQTPDS
ncbi:MAG: TlpA family protein disulfide reductase [Rhizobiaceae bacterium]|nr:TlpA family protein disulfide reductase [Rhizobiaceae bacterium]